MAEIYNDQKEQEQQVDEEIENDEDAFSMNPDSAFLFELNLVLVIASLSLSNQELSEFEEDVEKLNVQEQQDYKALVSKFNAHKRGFDNLKIADRRATRPKLQNKVFDPRHGRKM